jgi:hypothetical protein
VKREQHKFKITMHCIGNCSLQTADRVGETVTSFLERSTREGESPVEAGSRTNRASRRVELFGNAAQRGWYKSSKAKYRQETDSEQVP